MNDARTAGYRILCRLALLAGVAAALMAVVAAARQDHGFAAYFGICATGIFTGVLRLAESRR